MIATRVFEKSYPVPLPGSDLLSRDLVACKILFSLGPRGLVKANPLENNWEIVWTEEFR